MRGTTYHFEITDKPGVLKLRPTKTTYAKAFTPMLVVWGGIALAAIAMKLTEKKEDNSVTELDPDHK